MLYSTYLIFIIILINSTYSFIKININTKLILFIQEKMILNPNSFWTSFPDSENHLENNECELISSSLALGYLMNELNLRLLGSLESKPQVTLPI